MSKSKVCIITGSSAGLGLAAAKKWVAKDFHIIFACRDQAKTMPLIDKWREESGRSYFEFIKLNIGSFDSIRRFFIVYWSNINIISNKLNRFVADFHSKGLSLHLLINNAGIIPRGLKKSDDGIEYTFAVNHLGHCKRMIFQFIQIILCLVLLTNLLLDDLKRSSPSRIVVVSSKLHDPNFKWTLDEINNEVGVKIRFHTVSTHTLFNRNRKIYI